MIKPESRHSCRFTLCRLTGLATAVSAMLLVPSAIGQTGSSSSSGGASTQAPGAGAATQPPEGTPSETETPPASTDPQPAASDDYYRPTKADNATPKPQPPAYVKTVDEHAKHYGVSGLEDMDWLEFGLEYRYRFEHRDDDYRNGLTDQHQSLSRTDIYFGIKKIFDPLRFTLEVQDSRQWEAGFDDNVNDVDKWDILQGFAELYFPDAFGKDHPLSIRAGRMTIGLVDRRLVARNGFRNTTNAFDGFRLTMGQKKNIWQADVIAVMPVERLLEQPDRPDEERWLYGFVYTWRGWRNLGTVEVFYFVLDEDRKNPALLDREVHSIGTHVYGPIGTTGFDYDTNFTWQFGNDGPNTRRAFATHAELGYSWEHAWKPRLSVYCNYASGDPDAPDHLAERFDPMFGDSTSYGGFQIQRFENMINPNLRLTLKPHDKVELNGFYRAYWLARDADRSSWDGRIDPAGDSGDCVGQTVELMMKYNVCPNATIDLGYCHFFPGSFIDNSGRSRDSDFFFVSTTLQF